MGPFDFAVTFFLPYFMLYLEDEQRQSHLIGTDRTLRDELCPLQQVSCISQ